MMKKKISGILAALIFLTGLGIFTYPTISDQWNRYRQSKEIAAYEEEIVQLESDDLSIPWMAAKEYNQTITYNTFEGDVFSGEEQNEDETVYWSLLNVKNNGIMGYISIPKINQKLSIYHGTSDLVLQTGVGHIQGTKLPIGGAGSHSVLAGHRGLPSAELFSDIDQMEVGDKFYIHVLDEVLAYEVDQILPMIPKDDYETLSAAMQIEEGQDYITLFTCTPYGVNSHRLLVRGKRVAYNGEDDTVTDAVVSAETVVESVKNYYMFYIIAAVAVIIMIAVVIKSVGKLRLGKRNREEENEKV